MSAWTINGNVCRVAGCTLGVAGTDKAVAELLPGMGSPPSDGSWVTLACDGTPVLYGRATTKRSVGGNGDVTQVEIDGPWAVLEKTIYQQSQAMVVEDSGEPGGYAVVQILSPEVQLGMADDGTLRTTLQEVQAIVTYAIGAGVPITLDASFTGRQVPIVSMVGNSCAAALLAMLDHHPECLIYFAYGSGAATLSVKPVSGLPVTSFAGGSGGVDLVTDASFSKALDYKPEGVRIVYTRMSQFGRLETTTPDVAGDTGTQGKAPGVINWLVQLEGQEPGPVEEQEIKTNPIPKISEPTALKAFWKRHLTWMTDAIEPYVTISGYTRKVDPPGVEEDPSGEVPEEDYSLDPDDYPRELISGEIRPWMGRDSAFMTMKAKFSLTGGTLTDDLKEVFGTSGTKTKVAELKVTGTNASTRIYRSLGAGTVTSWPEPGIASGFMTAFSDAIWQGSVTLTGQDQVIVAPGVRINVSGYESEWTSMNAVVQSVSYDASSHRTTVVCGPPRAMDFGDFFSLQRVFKKRSYMSTTAAYERRVEGKSGKGGKVSGGQKTARHSLTYIEDGAVGSEVKALQTLVKKVGESWQVGITPGVFQTDESTVPTLEPDGTPLEGLPAYWWDDEFAADSEADTRLVYLKVFINDDDPYALKVDEGAGVEVHLLEDAPDTIFSPGEYQWIHIGTAASDGEGTMTATSHISGSLFGIRRGGPGSPISVYTS